ncbi:MAG: hypothetical protein U1E34_11500 [Amaricoccus sp.]
MRGSSKFRSFGRAVLMGSAIGVGIAGCTMPEGGSPATTQPSGQRELDYGQAVASHDPAQVTRFLETYPTSGQAASLLNQMPAEVLAQVPRSAVLGLNEGVKRQLTPRVRGQFSIPVDTGGSGGGGVGGGHYGG